MYRIFFHTRSVGARIRPTGRPAPGCFRRKCYRRDSLRSRFATVIATGETDTGQPSQSYRGNRLCNRPVTYISHDPYPDEFPIRRTEFFGHTLRFPPSSFTVGCRVPPSGLKSENTIVRRPRIPCRTDRTLRPNNPFRPS